ncbi:MULTISPECIES: hypothetical protein [unclassified Bradyrhizobium]
MSAINVLIQSSSVHVYTDAAIYQTDGTLAGIGPKVRPLPHTNAAMAMRGAYLGFAPIAEELSFARSFDALKRAIVPTLQACAEHYGHLLNQCAAGPDFEIVVAGVSETAGPNAYIVSSHDRYSEPWTILDLEGLSVTPANEAVHRIIGEIANGRAADDLDPIVDGLAVLEAQRAGDAGAFVGGFAQLTTVTVDSVTSRILRRWPDEIGEKIAA